MNKFVMFLYVIAYCIFLVPLTLICDAQRRWAPNFLNKFFNKIQNTLDL